MAADKAAEGLVLTLGLLHVERQGRKTLGEIFPLGVQAFNTAFTAARPNSGSVGKRE
nr:Uncharacterised protein [Raoultella sp. NCTC 9187]